MTSILHIQNLNVNYDNISILSDINLEISRGDYLCILGPNGAGKSTLLKSLMGITEITSGAISIHNQSQTNYSQKQLARLMGYVPQAHSQIMAFSVDEFVKMGRYPFHSALSEWLPEDQQAVDEAIEITDISAFKYRYINTLSGGERQRVMIAAVLAQQSPILLLDEPTNFLDPHHQVEVHQLVQKLNTQHQRTIIEVSHDLNHACQRSRTLLALKNGQSMWQGKASDFLQSEHLYDLYEQNFVFVEHPQTGAKIALYEEW